MPTAEIFDTTTENTFAFREMSISQSQKAYVVTAIIPQPTVAGTFALTSAWLHIDTEGGFHCQEISGSAQGPVDVNGVRKLSGGFTSFPKAGVSAAGGVADRGLRMQIVDVVTGRTVTTQLAHFTSAPPWADVNNLLNPGYDMGSYLYPMPFNMYMPRGAILRFDFQNWDLFVAGEERTLGYHRIDMVLSGVRNVGN